MNTIVRVTVTLPDGKRIGHIAPTADADGLFFMLIGMLAAWEAHTKECSAL